MRHAYHLHLPVIAHARLLQIRAKGPIDQPHRRGILHPAEPHLLQLREISVHDAEGIGIAHASEHTRLLDDGQDLPGHVDHDGVGVTVGHQPHQRPPPRHPKASRVVDDDQVRAPGLDAFGGDAGAGAGADDGAAGLHGLVEVLEDGRAGSGWGHT
jgi:hypothetical protein